MNLWLAPLCSLFSLRFYREAVRSPLSKGILYLVYLSLIASALLSGFFMVYGRPEIDRMLAWVESSLPPLTMTPEGLTMNAVNPYVMSHPQYGPIATFDMTKADITTVEMRTPIFFTATKIFVRGAANEMRIYPVTRPDRRLERPVSVNELFKKLRSFAHSAGVFFLAGFSFVFFFMWKLIAALFYSLIGCLVNLARRERLSYAAVFTAACFALTPAALIQIFEMGIPRLSFLAFGFLGSLILTAIYLVLAVKLTEERPSA